MRDVTPGIEADDDIERGYRELEPVNVAVAKLHQIAEPVFVRPRLGLRVTDDGDVHAQHSTAEVSCQVARRAAGAAPDVENGRSRHDAGSPGEVLDLVRRQRTFLSDIRVAVCEG
jgi:hypothetical protein